jgi:transcriptional regulator with XRE-family HTH domain
MASVSDQIGVRLRELRKSRSLTLDDLAERTEFTKSYLSKIENSKKIPPIASLTRICRALDTSMAALFDDNPRPGTLDPARGGADRDTLDRYCVVRADERRTVIRGGTSFGYDFKSLAHRMPGKHMEPFLFTYPETLVKEVHFEHEGEEFVFVISGRVRFFLGTEEIILEPGDSVYFDGTLPHRGEAMTGEAKALVVIYSPANSV